ncbi:unnamed protein product [marine sediment metagenome]|uniref:Uncharacterized protein n=1 Tax=marine sediment metagenome TaxID=412755 RepID=X0SX43_9ZZZZ
MAPDASDGLARLSVDDAPHAHHGHVVGVEELEEQRASIDALKLARAEALFTYCGGASAASAQLTNTTIRGKM